MSSNGGGQSPNASTPDDMGHLEPPTHAELRSYAAHKHMRLSDDELKVEHARVAGLLSMIGQLEKIDAPPNPGRWTDRCPGRPPREDEDPYRAIIRFCRVTGADNGPLAGMRIGVKDNIAVAGVPMTGGTRHQPPTVPAEDAVVVEQVLDAGATITAKTNINGDGAHFGYTRNPHNPRFWSGGSSSGSAAAVAAGIVDAALGHDVGASIRQPAAWCGLVGMKPTLGLVPSYGLLYWDHTLDHIGPITTTVADNAAMLQVIAGNDWRNPQCAGSEPMPGVYTDMNGLDLTGMRMGVITESLEEAGCTQTVLERFSAAQRSFVRLGAEIVPVSIPLWSVAASIWFAVLATGMTAMDSSLGQGASHLGRIDVHRLASTGHRHLLESRELDFGGRTFPLVVEHLRHAYYGIPLANAQNLRLELRNYISRLLSELDLLITPTTPTGPPKIPTQPHTTSAEEFHSSAWTPIFNTCPLNLTGHPAITVPSGLGDHGIPTGLQIIGRHFDERTIYRAAHAYEKLAG